MIRKQFDEHQDLHTSTYSLILTTGTVFGFMLDAVSITFISVVTYSFVALDHGNSLLQLLIIVLSIIVHDKRMSTYFCQEILSLGMSV